MTGTTPITETGENGCEQQGRMRMREKRMKALKYYTSGSGSGTGCGSCTGNGAMGRNCMWHEYEEEKREKRRETRERCISPSRCLLVLATSNQKAIEATSSRVIVFSAAVARRRVKRKQEKESKR